MQDDPLDEVAARLYALPPQEFVAARDDAVARARAAGDRPLAARIGKLRKPTVGAWLVNLLAHKYPDLIAELFQLGEQLRAAQRDLRGDELRDLSLRRRESVSALARRAVALARRHESGGRPPGVPSGRGAPAARSTLPVAEVEATLTAALAEPEVAAEVRAGRLTKTVAYAGFGEPPRPRLRLVQGGLDAQVATLPAPHRGAEAGPTGGAAAEAGEDGAGAEAGAEAGAAGDAVTAGVTGAARPGTEPAAARAAEAAARAAERAERERRRRERAAVQRELLAARTGLAEAEAAKAAAERAVADARRRVEQAMDALEALGD